MHYESKDTTEQEYEHIGGKDIQQDQYRPRRMYRVFSECIE